MAHTTNKIAKASQGRESHSQAGSSPKDDDGPCSSPQLNHQLHNTPTEQGEDQKRSDREAHS